MDPVNWALQRFYIKSIANVSDMHIPTQIPISPRKQILCGAANMLSLLFSWSTRTDPLHSQAYCWAALFSCKTCTLYFIIHTHTHTSILTQTGCHAPIRILCKSIFWIHSTENICLLFIICLTADVGWGRKYSQSFPNVPQDCIHIGYCETKNLQYSQWSSLIFVLAWCHLHNFMFPVLQNINKLVHIFFFSPRFIFSGAVTPYDTQHIKNGSSYWVCSACMQSFDMDAVLMILSGMTALCSDGLLASHCP